MLGDAAIEFAERIPQFMNQLFNKIMPIFVAIPVMITTLPVNTIEYTATDLSKIEWVIVESIALGNVDDLRAKRIDAYYEQYNLPLNGHGDTMVKVADKYNIDWRLIPAIAMRESTGGKFACKNVPFNAFGWYSCKRGFDSWEHAIDYVGWNLGGFNPRTAKYYKDKTTEEIINSYNPPEIVASYQNDILSIMNRISQTKV